MSGDIGTPGLMREDLEPDFGAVVEEGRPAGFEFGEAGGAETGAQGLVAGVEGNAGEDFVVFAVGDALGQGLLAEELAAGMGGGAALEPGQSVRVRDGAEDVPVFPAPLEVALVASALGVGQDGRQVQATGRIGVAGAGFAVGGAARGAAIE